VQGLHIQGVQVVLLYLPGQFLDLLFYVLVFLHFSFEKTKGYAGFGFQAAGGEDVDILELVPRAPEAIDLDKALFGQLCEAVVDLAQADAHSRGHLALGKVVFAAQDLEQAVVDLLV